jgi:hypothetical protein
MRVHLVLDPELAGALCHDLLVNPIAPERGPYRYAGVTVSVSTNRPADRLFSRPMGLRPASQDGFEFLCLCDVVPVHAELQQ